jgi:hypothetical protein
MSALTHNQKKLVNHYIGKMKAKNVQTPRLAAA